MDALDNNPEDQPQKNHSGWNAVSNCLASIKLWGWPQPNVHHCSYGEVPFKAVQGTLLGQSKWRATGWCSSGAVGRLDSVILLILTPAGTTGTAVSVGTGLAHKMLCQLCHSFSATVTSKRKVKTGKICDRWHFREFIKIKGSKLPQHRHAQNRTA